MITPLGKGITRNRMTVIEQLAQILLTTTEIGGSISIVNALMTYIENRTDPDIKPTISHFKQETGPGYSEQNHSPIGSLHSGIGFPRYWRNIDNRTGMNPQGLIVTTIPESNGASKCDIFNLVSRTSDLAYRVSS